MILVCSVADHVGKTIPEVRVIKRAVFELELEARIQSNKYSCITLTYNTVSIRHGCLGETRDPTRCQGLEVQRCGRGVDMQDIRRPYSRSRATRGNQSDDRPPHALGVGGGSTNGTRGRSHCIDADKKVRTGR